MGWGEVVLFSFRTVLQLTLLRHNADSTNHITNFGVPNIFKTHFSIILNHQDDQNGVEKNFNLEILVDLFVTLTFQ